MNKSNYESVKKSRAKMRRIELLLSPELYEQLKMQADFRGLSLSAFVKVALLDYVPQGGYT